MDSIYIQIENMLQNQIPSIYAQSLIHAEEVIQNKLETIDRSEGCLRRVLEVPYGLICQRLRDIVFEHHPLLNQFNMITSPQQRKEIYIKEKYSIIRECDVLDSLWRSGLTKILGKDPVECYLRFRRIHS